MVKMMRRDQDERFDIPTVGPATLQNMAQAKLTCLALHAGWTLIMEPQKFKELAEKENISVVGVDPCRSF